MKYPKIDTLFKRDERNIIIPGNFTCPEFEYLENNLWECTEKIDGTNIRVMIDYYSEDLWDITYGGRTDNAQIPSHLLKKLKERFDDLQVNEIFSFKEPCQIVLYGEGYGKSIQKGHNYIPNGVDFILFDIKIGRWWIKRDALESIAENIGIEIVPLIGYKRISEAIHYVKEGFKSKISHNKDYDAEGLILKTPDGLLFRNGQRIITKLKTSDFRKYMNSL